MMINRYGVHRIAKHERECLRVCRGRVGERIIHGDLSSYGTTRASGEKTYEH